MKADIVVTWLGGSAVGSKLRTTHPMRAAIMVRWPGSQRPSGAIDNESEPKEESKIHSLFPSQHTTRKNSSEEPMSIRGQGVGISNKEHSKHGPQEHGQDTLEEE